MNQETVNNMASGPSDTARHIAARIWQDQDMAHIPLDAETADKIAGILDTVLAGNDRLLSFEQQLASTINQYNREIRSDTPDFLLAAYLIDVLVAIEKLIVARDHWYGLAPCPGRDPMLPFSSRNYETLLRIGAVLLIGKRRWRFVKMSGTMQGEDGWHFQLMEEDVTSEIDTYRIFTRSEVQWLVAHYALISTPDSGEGFAL